MYCKLKITVKIFFELQHLGTAGPLDHLLGYTTGVIGSWLELNKLFIYLMRFL